VSWIFSFLLLCYALVRVVLRVRGQLRWLAIRKTLPTPPPMVEAPEHLSPGLSGLFVTSRTLRAELCHSRRTLTAVAVQDPDAPLGQVRDTRYRRAVIESWTLINTWLRSVNKLGELDAAELADAHISAAAIEQLRDAMHDSWRAASQARALEPFPIAQLVANQRALEQLELELVAIERGLARVNEHPYRRSNRRNSRPGSPQSIAAPG